MTNSYVNTFKTSAHGISSTEEGAIEKLEAKLAKLQNLQDYMKRVNKEYKKGGVDAITDITDETREKVRSAMAHQASYLKDQPFQPYELTNNNATIRNTKKRIAEITATRDAEPVEFDHPEFSISTEEGRFVIEFTGGKPSEDIRNIVKGHGFKWSRYQVAWVRKATLNAMHSVRYCQSQLVEAYA